MPRFSDKVVIVTGAGAGIGRALVKGFVREGARVTAIGRSAEGLEGTRATALGPGSLSIHVCDVADAAAVEEVFRKTVARDGAVDLLVNNAAVYPKALLADFEPEVWGAGVATNLNGVAFCCRAAIRTFPAGHQAVIFNVGSFAYRGPEPRSTLYCATKAGVNALTRAVAVELAAARSPLIINEWVPGIYRTQMGIPDGDDPDLAFTRLVAAWQKSLGGRGGRVFAMDQEMLPPRSLRSRLLSMLLLRRR